VNDILFSSTSFDRKELTHVNVQPPEYCAEQFSRHGFYRNVDCDASFITAWAAGSRKRDEPARRVFRDYERRFALLEIECNEIRERGLDLERELARHRMRRPQKAVWFVSSATRLLRAGGR
jgi:hypothetical protein